MVLSFQWQQVTRTNIPHPSHASVCNNRHQVVSFPSVKSHPTPSPFLSSCFHCYQPLSSFPSVEKGKIECKIQCSRLWSSAVPMEKWSGQPLPMLFSWGGVEQIVFRVSSVLMRVKERLINISWSVKESNKHNHSGAASSAGRCWTCKQSFTVKERKVYV